MIEVIMIFQITIRIRMIKIVMISSIFQSICGQWCLIFIQSRVAKRILFEGPPKIWQKKKDWFCHVYDASEVVCSCLWRGCNILLGSHSACCKTGLTQDFFCMESLRGSNTLVLCPRGRLTAFWSWLARKNSTKNQYRWILIFRKGCPALPVQHFSLSSAFWNENTSDLILSSSPFLSSFLSFWPNPLVRFFFSRLK